MIMKQLRTQAMGMPPYPATFEDNGMSISVLYYPVKDNFELRIYRTDPPPTLAEWETFANAWPFPVSRQVFDDELEHNIIYGTLFKGEK